MAEINVDNFMAAVNRVAPPGPTGLRSLRVRCRPECSFVLAPAPDGVPVVDLPWLRPTGGGSVRPALAFICFLADIFDVSLMVPADVPDHDAWFGQFRPFGFMRGNDGHTLVRLPKSVGVLP